MNNHNHYFSPDPKSEVVYHDLKYTVGNVNLALISSSGVFSKSEVDEGSDALVRTIIKRHQSTGRLLDLGCGYGVIGIALAKLLSCEAVLCDINPRAVELANKNIRANKSSAVAIVSDGFEKIERSFDLIVTNPPIRAGKDVYYSWFEKAPGYLEDGGSFWCVIRKKQGAPSARQKLEEVFGNCEIANRDRGYYILVSKKQA